MQTEGKYSTTPMASQPYRLVKSRRWRVCGGPPPHPWLSGRHLPGSNARLIFMLYPSTRPILLSAAVVLAGAFLPGIAVHAQAPTVSATPSIEPTNRLIHEKSPYLLQHAHNPVDWYPWGEEAFTKARKENKPIFLSVGYSTCHWCHVMERESFENPAIAKLMNDNFRVDQGGPGGTAGCGRDLHDLHPGGHRRRGLADDRFPDPGTQAVSPAAPTFPPEDRDGQSGLKTILPKIARSVEGSMRPKSEAQADPDSYPVAEVYELPRPPRLVRDAPGASLIDVGYDSTRGPL